MTDVVAVVTRYFGGALLGAGGLVRAYSGAVAEALDHARLVRRELLTEVTLDVAHADAGRIDHLLRDWAATHGAVLEDVRYLDVARFAVLVPPAELGRLTDDLAAASAGSLAPTPGAVRVVDVPER